MNNQNTELMTQNDFLLPTMVQGDFSNDELADDMDGMQMSFPRIKIPSGGTIQFEIPTDDPENPDYTKTLTGVILYHHPNYAYWAEGSEYDENATPLCTSVDGKKGIGDPGGICSECALNEYGSASEGRGKACKNMRMLYLLCSGEYMPYQLALPPTSLKPFKDFINQAFLLRRRTSYGSIVQISLKKVSNGSNDYSVAVFRRILDFEGEKLAQVRAYAESFKQQVKLSLQQRAAANEANHEDICEYVDGTPSSPQSANTGESFCIGQTLDGEHEELPA